MDPITLALGAWLAPFAASFAALVLLRRRPGAASAVVVLAGLVAMAASLALLAAGPLPEPVTRSWLPSEVLDLRFGFLLDAPSLLMGAVVGCISFAVLVYSLGYMAGDPGRSRFFALLGLFEASMLGFVYAASLLQAFVFWELVGLASFLLIGFWFERPSAVAAARKAFLMTRVGDVALLLGVFVLFESAGTLDIATLNAAETLASLPPEKLRLATLLMLGGICGKSAQVPLHTWLPDAMEGPTPVSSLLHSATMVAAGVFLLARFHPLFLAAPDTMAVALAIGSVTALLAASSGLVARDMKRVLAYSSISQLGYMVMALAAGGLAAGLFHLLTHAVFKCLLFLTAGAFIHHAGSNDLEEIGRSGARSLRPAAFGLLAGAGALAGLPPLAGFFSKEAVLHALGSGPALWAGLLAAFLTATYAFRMVFLVLLPRDVSPPHHPHAPPATMNAPIVLLGAGAALAGFLGPWVAAFLGSEAFHLDLAGAAPAVFAALLGVAVAWLDFGRAGVPRIGFAERIPAVHRLFANGWYFDAFYDRAVVRPVLAVARACRFTDTEGLDAAGDGLAGATIAAGGATARTQAGPVQLYVATTILTAAVLGLYLVLR